MNTKHLWILIVLISIAVVAALVFTSDTAIAPSPTENTQDVVATEATADTEITFENFVVHTTPGEYSHIEVRGSGYRPGEKVIIYHKRTGTDTWEPGFETFADDNGDISDGIKIYSFGSYDILAGRGETTVVVE